MEHSRSTKIADKLLKMAENIQATLYVSVMQMRFVFSRCRFCDLIWFHRIRFDDYTKVE